LSETGKEGALVVQSYQQTAAARLLDQLVRNTIETKQQTPRACLSVIHQASLECV
jgi:hypothetical protein